MPETKETHVAVPEVQGATKSDIGVAVSTAPSTDDGHVAPRKAGKMDVLVQGVALFSDGYNIQIIGYMNTVLKELFVHITRDRCYFH